MLTHELFNVFTYVGAEWVLWLLVALSVISIAVVVERLIFFRKNSAPEAAELLPMLAAGKFDQARSLLEGKHGLEANVIRAAIEAAPNGPESVEEVIAGTIVRYRPPYERFLAFLGTLGNNAPFVGLFGTVIGIIKAFADLAVGTAEGGAGAGSSVVMAGISEALVATAVGIFVAIPAVVAFNGYNRWLKTIVARTNACGHAVVAYLKREEA
ncbi:MotA/TolQ/ExbB proton channel family protein [Vulgatibacter sp.]|uniref:MotA/TolQ/ExbB proton channel family protein n=1 Tax=Vulgatibacter sp. TaxID=1971226 RepID=UPI0035639B4D